MTTHALTDVPSGNLLSTALKANAAFSTVSGLVCIFASGMVAAFLGLPAWGPNAILTLGIGLLGFAVLVYYTATRQPIRSKDAMGIIIGDAAWVIASWAILAIGIPALSTAGFWTVAIVADIVTVFAIVQFYGLRKYKAD